MRAAQKKSPTESQLHYEGKFLGYNGKNESSTYTNALENISNYSKM